MPTISFNDLAKILLPRRGYKKVQIDSLSSLRAALNQIKAHDPIVLQVERGGGLQWLAFEME